MKYNRLIVGILVAGLFAAPVSPLYKNSTDIGSAFAEEQLSANSDPAKLKAKLAEIDKRISETPSAKLYGAKANVLAFLNLNSEALLAIDKAIELKPTDGKYYAYKGLLYSSKGDADKTITNIEKGKSLGYTDPEYLGILALAQTEVHDFKKALVNANAAIEMDKSCYPAWYARGRVKNYRKDFKNALPDLTQAIKLAQELSGPYTERAITWDGLGNKKNAIADREKASKLKLKLKR
ncbi:MAG: hypothetical protein SFY67_17660 [Candidatus Melainabacteria bacterium]|nr:hypothetical protein [Candidatus Melainabacteria bacterium]